MSPLLDVQTGAKGKGKKVADEKGKGKELAKGKGNVQGGNDDEDGEEHDDIDIDPSFKDKDDLSALYIVQQVSRYFILLKIHNSDMKYQVWAQASKADTSIMVVQSGNHEFVGIRHRLSQTLYVSDIIQPHACEEPSYGKIHVGIYVAAVLDAIDRAKQRAAGIQDGLPGGGQSGGPSDCRDNHEDNEKPRDGGNKKSGGRKKTGDDNPQEGGSTGSGGTMLAIAVHEMAAKVCTI